jgi:hypothetical protein
MENRERTERERGDYLLLGSRSPSHWPCDAPKMHLLFQVLCFIFFSRIIHYLNKTAEFDAIFSKVPFLAIFAGNKIGEKYYANFSCEGV